MSATAALVAPRTPARDVPWWAIVAPLFLTQMPIVNDTGPGHIIRLLLLVGIVALVVMRLNALAARVSTAEKLMLAALPLLTLCSTLSGLVLGYAPDPGEILKFVALDIACFAVGRCVADARNAVRLVEVYYWICIVAALQGCVAIALDTVGMRQMHAIPLYVEADRRYFLPWFGLLGGDVGNLRTNFYFSESTYFAQMLIPAIAYALVSRRWIGFGVLVVGLGTTSSASGAAGMAGVVLLLTLRMRIPLWLIAMFVVGAGIAAYVVLHLLEGSTALFTLLDRGKSVSDKLESFQFIVNQLRLHPFGVGPVNANDTFGTLVNTSNGLLQLLVLHGVLAAPFIAVLLGALAWYGVIAPRGPVSAALAVGLLGAAASGITHGPLLKYYALTLFGLMLVIADAEAGATAGTRAPADPPAPPRAAAAADA